MIIQSACALVAVVSGEVYERYAHELWRSAFDYFLPNHDWNFFSLEGRPGWPAATLYRYHTIVENEDLFQSYDHLFLCDADMRFEDEVGDEILGPLVATIHPGYVTTPRRSFPYESNPASQAYVPSNQGQRYYAGGFVGGERLPFLRLACQLIDQIDEDDRNGILATWHDESHLNAALVRRPPVVELTPAYCHPDKNDWYLSSWPEHYERKLVALDKTPAERGKR